MEKFRATDYLKSNLTSVLAEIIDFWEEDRGAHISNAEAVYDLRKTKDFKYILEKYGVEKAIHTYSKAQFVIDGENFTEPFILKYDNMLNIIDDAYDIEYMRMLYESENNAIVKLFDEWFDMHSVVAHWKTNYTIQMQTTHNVLEEVVKVLDKYNVGYQVTW